MARTKHLEGQHDQADHAGDRRGGAQEPTPPSRPTPTTDQPTQRPRWAPDPHEDANGDGVTDAARVGVGAFDVPPPPAIGILENLPEDVDAVQHDVIAAFEADPDGMAQQYIDGVLSGKIGEEGVFNTDDAKMLSVQYRESLESRARYNIAVHNTANAIAKRAFSKYLQEHVAQLPEEERVVLVTVGGVAAGKGYSLEQNPNAVSLKSMAAATWDTAGEQNGTELPWVARETEKIGAKMKVVYVHSDPEKHWANPEMGAVHRSKKKGRMVDARLFAESYVVGQQNFSNWRAKMPSHAEAFVIDSTANFALRDTAPEINHDVDSLHQFAVEALKRSDVPDWIKRAGTIGNTIWSNKTESNVPPAETAPPEADKTTSMLRKANPDDRDDRDEDSDEQQSPPTEESPVPKQTNAPGKPSAEMEALLNKFVENLRYNLEHPDEVDEYESRSIGQFLPQGDQTQDAPAPPAQATEEAPTSAPDERAENGNR